MNKPLNRGPAGEWTVLDSKGAGRDGAASRRVQVARKVLFALMFFCGSFLFAPAVLAGQERDPALETVRLQLRWLHGFQFAGYYAAVEKGFYRDAGLNVELIEGTLNASVNYAQVVASGQAEYGADTSKILLARLQGEPIVVLAAIFQHSPLVLLSLKDSGLDTPQDFIGRTVSLGTDAATRAMFLKEGGDPDQLNLSSSWDYNDLVEGRIDAITAYTTDQPSALKKEGVEVNIIRPTTYGIDFYGDCLFTSEQEVREHPDRVEAFRSASLRGWEYAMNHVEEMVELIHENYQPQKSPEALRFEAEEMNKLMLSEFIDIGHMNPGRWKHIADTYVELGMASKPYSLDGFIYSSESARLQQWKKRAALVALGVVFFVFLAVLVLFVFNRLLKKQVKLRTEELTQEIAERKQVEQDRFVLQEKLRQSEKLQAVGQLAGGIAHDFNNILQAILGFGELALGHVRHDDLLKGHIEQIMRSGKNAVVLVGQLLAFSRQQVLKMEDLSLNEVVENLVKMIQRLLGEHIVLEVVPGPNLGVVRADRGQLGQILTNLCVNARDAMPDGGTITIETQNIQVDEEFSAAHDGIQAGRYILLTITDTGHGMDAQTLAQVFEPFFTTKEVGKGTGLGLSTVYGLVKQHNGTIDVYSELGKGTMFKIYLPVIARTATSICIESKGPVPGGNETILLAEDAEAVRTVCEEMLEEAGYTVISVENGEAALQVLENRSEEIDLALLDVIMPKLGGRVVYDRIQESYPHIHVLFASGYSINAVHTNFILHEGLELIQKPYRRTDLLRKIRDILGS